MRPSVESVWAKAFEILSRVHLFASNYRLCEYLTMHAIYCLLLKISATRGLLATDHVILNHGQVTWTTPELEPPSPNYHTTPTGGRFSSRQIERASLPYTVGLWWYWARTRDKASHGPIPIPLGYRGHYLLDVHLSGLMEILASGLIFNSYEMRVTAPPLIVCFECNLERQ
ncbi:hypothetical protein TNCV_2999721 [Trichonephila clavipes]|nr:hypothetical protein TNCV_2999721 [Trichonephila clavipes]